MPDPEEIKASEGWKLLPLSDAFFVKLGVSFSGSWDFNNFASLSKHFSPQLTLG